MKLPCNCNPPIHSYHDNLAKPMNTKWEETFDEEFSLNKCGERWIDGTLLDSLEGLRQDIKDFIKDQITKARMERCEHEQPFQCFRLGCNSKASSDMPKTMTEVALEEQEALYYAYMKKQIGNEALRSLMPEIENLDRYTFENVKGKLIRLDSVLKLIQSRSEGIELEDQITKAQQEIAEQIIEGIPHSLGGVEGESVYAFQLTKLKEKLRKKYL